MTHAVAPGNQGFNLLSKRHLFRIALAKSEAADPNNPLVGPLVVESKDGSYYYECEFDDAADEGDLLVFDLFLKDRDKEYACYFKDQQKGRFRWSKVPRKLVDLDDTEGADASPDQSSDEEGSL